MKKIVFLIILTLCIVLFSGCNSLPFLQRPLRESTQAEKTTRRVSKNNRQAMIIEETALVSETSETTVPSATVEPTPFESSGNPLPASVAEMNYIQWLSGTWEYYEPMNNNILCHIFIDEDMNASIHFQDLDTTEEITYTGKAVPEWSYTDQDTDLPTDLSFDIDNPSGEYISSGEFIINFTLHKDSITMKMGLASYDEEGTIFDILGYQDWFTFYQPTEYRYTGTPHKNEIIFGEFWEIDHEQAVIWIEPYVYNEDAAWFFSERNETVPYPLSPDIVYDFPGNEFYPHAMYLLTTNSEGAVILIQEAILD